MNIFGVTPIDTALSVMGLNCAQLFTDFFSRGTSVALLVFTAGLLFSVWRTTGQGSYRHLITYAFLVLFGVLLLLPNKNEGTIKSALEVYAGSTNKGQAIKDEILDYHQIPVALGTLAEMGNALVLGLIHAIDLKVPEWARYLTAPFGIQRSCLFIREAISVGVNDVPLKGKLNGFLYDHYLPALGRLKNDSPSEDMSQIWPGHLKITSYYTDTAKREWRDLEGLLSGWLDLNPMTGEDSRRNIALAVQKSDAEVKQSIIKGMIFCELGRLQDGPLNIDAWGVSFWVINAYPYFSGIAHLILYASFPFMFLFALLNRSMSIASFYLKTFIGVHSLHLCSAFAFYSSILLARIQSGSIADPSSIWMSPYYCVPAAVLLVLFPVAVFLMINQRRMV